MRMLVAAVCTTAFAMSATAQVTGTGTSGTVPVFTGAAALGNSPIAVSGSSVGIGTTIPETPLQVVGTGNVVSIGEASNTSGRQLLLGVNISGIGYATIQSIDQGTAYTPLVLNPNGGDIGIGTASPGASLEVNGGIKLTSGSTGGITFADGSVQTSAVATQTQAGGASLAGLVLDNTYTSPCTTTSHAYKIATLITSSAGTFDHLHVFVTLNNSWLSGTNSYLDAAFANRNGFNYSYTVRGSAVGSTAKLTAYQNSSGGVDIYIQDYGCSNTSYSVIENQQETVYPNPVDYGSSIAGTLVFDSSSSSYLPSTFTNYSGNLGIGTTTPGAKLEVSGNVKLTAGSGASMTFQDGSVQSVAWNGVLGGGDYAESVDVIGDRTQYEPGDVMVIDPSSKGKFMKSARPYETSVMGIYSTRPGVVGRRQKSDRSHMSEEVPMAMVGVVPTKASTESGPIKPGDLLVTSSKPGYAMKGTDHSQLMGAIIGKALEPLDTGTGVIEVAVSIQ